MRGEELRRDDERRGKEFLDVAPCGAAAGQTTSGNRGEERRIDLEEGGRGERRRESRRNEKRRPSTPHDPTAGLPTYLGS